MTRIAAVDCGTNSIRLLISDITRTSSAPSGFTAHEVTRRMEIVRLGQSVDATGELAPELRQHHEIRECGKGAHGCHGRGA